jgi:hypothetical protein
LFLLFKENWHRKLKKKIKELTVFDLFESFAKSNLVLLLEPLKMEIKFLCSENKGKRKFCTSALFLKKNN